jgi:peptide/nickel transport system permease protein
MITIMKRLGLGVATLFVVSAIIFSSISMLPGDFGEAVLGQAATKETVAAFRKELGLDKPAPVRYFEWVGSVLQGDLGTSFSGRNASGQDRSRQVSVLVAPRLWNTLFLAGVTALIAVPLALFLGLTAALYRNTAYDRTVNAATLTTISTPGILCRLHPDPRLCVAVAGVSIAGQCRRVTPLGERLYRIALPALTLTLVIVAHMMRMTRAAIINLLASPYIEMARLKGASQSEIILKHALAQCLGADRHRDRLQPRLSGCRRCRRRGGVRLSRHRPVDGRRRDQPRYSGRPGLRPDFRRHLYSPEPDRRHHRHRHQPAIVASQMSEPTETYAAAAEVGAVRKRRSRLERIGLLLKSAPPSAWFGMIVVALYILVALLRRCDRALWRGTDPSGAFCALGRGPVFFGTDQIGRDVLTRLIYGARNTMGIALATTLLSFLIGGGLGLVAAINRSWLDQFLSRFVDVLMAIPSLIFALMLLSIFGSTVTSLIMIIAVLDSTRVFRLTRAVAVNVAVMDYVEAARLRGEGLGWVMRREILPNIMPPLIAEFGLRFCFVFLTIAALSFLGVGIQPPTADWGSMVRENASLIQFAKYDMTAAITPLLPAAIALLTVAVNFIVDWFLHKTSGLRDDQ